jgi:type III pantothenate kinase
LITLQFDIGNTRLKWRKLKGGSEIVARGHSVCGGRQKFLQEPKFWDSVTALHLSSVGGNDVVSEIKSQCSVYAPGANVFVAKSQLLSSSVMFAYKDVSRMGVDRCLALIAAQRLLEELAVKKDVLVVDAGSALTADYLACDGRHRGGYIMCGLEMMKVALGSQTSRIRLSSDVAVVGRVGNSTESCVSEGITFMFRATVRRLVDEALEDGALVILTGGDSLGLSGGYESGVVLSRPDLVFEGLLYAAEGIA